VVHGEASNSVSDKRFFWFVSRIFPASGLYRHPSY